MRLLVPGVVLRSVLSAVALSVLTATSGEAQMVVGHVSGRVVTTNGIPVSGVAIVARGAGLIGSRSAVTDTAGRFNLLALPVGRYDLQARRPGFRGVLAPNVLVKLGETATLQGLVMDPVAAVELPERIVTE